MAEWIVVWPQQCLRKEGPADSAPINDCYNIRGLFHILLDEIDLEVLRDSAVPVHRSTEQIEVDGEQVSQESASSIVEVLQEFFRKSSSFPLGGMDQAPWKCNPGTWGDDRCT